MEFPKTYPFLEKNKFSIGDYSILPIRYEDRYKIMDWRNEQIDILRQKQPLSKEYQDSYFENVVAKLFVHDKPEQILFSYFQNKQLIGYGGLVHIDWQSRNAEISFLLDTEKNSRGFYLKSFSSFLKLMEEVAVNLKLHKIFTVGYDIEDYRFIPLKDNFYNQEACLKDHIKVAGKMVDVKIYSKIL